MSRRGQNGPGGLTLLADTVHEARPARARVPELLLPAARGTAARVPRAVEDAGGEQDAEHEAEVVPVPVVVHLVDADVVVEQRDEERDRADEAVSEAEPEAGLEGGAGDGVRSRRTAGQEHSQVCGRPGDGEQAPEGGATSEVHGTTMPGPAFTQKGLRSSTGIPLLLGTYRSREVPGPRHRERRNRDPPLLLLVEAGMGWSAGR